MALRSGSKGVKGKNIRPLNGIPLFAHAAKAVTGSKAYRAGGTLLIIRTPKSTQESRMIRGYTPLYGQKSMAGDKSPIREAIDYTFKFFDEKGETFDLFGLIQATSPFTISEDLDRAVSVPRMSRAPSLSSL